MNSKKEKGRSTESHEDVEYWGEQTHEVRVRVKKMEFRHDFWARAIVSVLAALTGVIASSLSMTKVSFSFSRTNLIKYGGIALGAIVLMVAISYLVARINQLNSPTRTLKRGISEVYQSAIDRSKLNPSREDYGS